MSRMLAYVTPAPAAITEAVGHQRLAELHSLARVHSDGWGTAWVDAAGTVGQAGDTDQLGESGSLGVVASEPTSLRMVYLRFASRGSAPSVENIQPFLREGVAFQHNGALAPIDAVREMLGERESAALRGTTDSEVYFAVVRQRATELAGAAWASTTVLVDAVRHVVGELRSRYPASCLNAFLLTSDALIVVQSQGDSVVPLETFARRGFDRGDLPPGHDASYNALRWTTTPSGAVIVATSGVDTTGWSSFDDGTVSVFSPTASTPDTIRI